MVIGFKFNPVTVLAKRCKFNLFTVFDQGYCLTRSVLWLMSSNLNLYCLAVGFEFNPVTVAVQVHLLTTLGAVYHKLTVIVSGIISRLDLTPLSFQ